jgi:hypothetical protein
LYWAKPTFRDPHDLIQALRIPLLFLFYSTALVIGAFAMFMSIQKLWTEKQFSWQLVAAIAISACVLGCTIGPIIFKIVQP